MSMYSYTVASGAPTAVTMGGWSEPMTVTNNSLVTVYVGNQSGLTADNGTPINPGGTVLWDKNKPCWAIAASGTANIRVLSNVGEIFNPYAIAQAINLIGVPAVNRSGTLVTATTILGTFDVTQYTSVVIDASFFSGVPSTTSYVTITWTSDSAGLNVIDTTTLNLACDTAMNGGVPFYAVVRVRGPYMTVTPSTGTVYGTLNATTVNLPPYVYNSVVLGPTGSPKTSVYSYSDSSLGSGASFTAAIPSLNGPATGTATLFSAPASGAARFTFTSTLGAILRVSLTAMDQSPAFSFNVPQAPCTFSVTNATPGNISIRFTVSYNDVHL